MPVEVGEASPGGIDPDLKIEPLDLVVDGALPEIVDITVHTEPEEDGFEEL